MATPSMNTLISTRAHPAVLQHARRRRRRTGASARGPAADTPVFEAAHLAQQQQAGDDMHDAQHHQGGAPADQVAQQAARRLAEHDAQDLPRDVARQHRPGGRS